MPGSTMIRQTFLLLILFLSASVGIAADASKMLGKPQPGFVLPDLNNTLRSHTHWNNKLLVINFWATWCPPCLKEIPMFNRLQNEYGPDGVQFIGIAVDNRDAIQQFIAKTPIEYPVLYGVKEATAVTQAYGNRAGVLPFTVFVDRRGRIQVIAPGQLSEGYTRKTLEKLL